MRALLTFSGIAGPEGPPLPALRRLYRRPENARFFTTAIEAVDRALDHVGPAASEHLPGGVRLADWLHGATPPPEVHHHSLVDGLLAHVYQLCLLQPRNGAITGRLPARPPVAAIGHSLGVLAALIAGMRVADRREYLALCRYSVTMTTLVLVRCHQPRLVAAAGEDALRRHAERYPQGPAPAPMATVTGIAGDELTDLVTAHNDALGEAAVHVAITNAPRSHVLAGAAADLAEFRLRAPGGLDRPGTRWTFLASTAPFHSKLLEPALDQVRADGAGLDHPITGDRLAVPVYVGEVPHNLQERADVTDDVVRQAICGPVDWPGTVRSAVDGSSPDQVLDFGPGAAARVFTRECLRPAGRELRYRTVTPDPGDAREGRAR